MDARDKRDKRGHDGSPFKAVDINHRAAAPCRSVPAGVFSKAFRSALEPNDAALVPLAVEREGRRRLVICGDVADAAFCRDAVERTVQEFGHLDILVNNAAFQEHSISFEDLSDEHFDRTLKTNLYGYFYMARAAAPHMKAGGSRAIAHLRLR